MNTTAKRALSIDGLAAIQTAGGARLSRDGKKLVCVVTMVEGIDRVDTLVLVDVLSKQQTILGSGSSPEWSPSKNVIACMGELDEKQGIILYSLDNGSQEFLAPVHLSEYFVDHYASANFSWSPDGQSIAYVSAIQTVPEETESIQVFDNLLYKTKGGRGRNIYSDKSRNQLWLVDVADKRTRCITASSFASHSLSWSPDGKAICFISNTTGKEDRNQTNEVFAVDVASGAIRKISEEKGSCFQPVWSPDGKSIAYLGITSDISTNDSPAEDTQLFTVSSTGGAATCLTRMLDRRVEQPRWDHASQCIYFTANDSGHTCLHRVSLASGAIETVIRTQGRVYEYDLSSDGKKIVYVHTDTVSTPDIFLLDTGTQVSEQLTATRKELLDNYSVQPAEEFFCTSKDSLSIQGWLMKPVLFDAKKKFPLILVIHGGPHNMFGNEFEDRMQVLAANGYGVVFLNPRGSNGYGQDFAYGCVKAWGEGDFEDLMCGVDHVLENHSWLDPTRLGVTGQSYGGYMTNRIITKTNRFKAAVADGSISNLVSFAGTSLYHSLMESEFGGSVYDHFDLLWNCSPLKDVKNAVTPVLFLHGETDNEVPFSQAEEMFVAIKK